MIGLAGTMGGFDTEITSETTNVMIEAAHFDQVSVARMARKLRLVSEASKRFERGVDPRVAPIAAQRWRTSLSSMAAEQSTRRTLI